MTFAMVQCVNKKYKYPVLLKNQTKVDQLDQFWYTLTNFFRG
ncbi:hypothetical protein MNB_SUP05-SYMBIONT-4-382 [hydrothermal vent metagenome]|uniref:Uncharacterized protein n=1 Tax=hydrothermal vent metagenome TaxID=652676 RepID=A0A1W1DZN0_9ZZZZ